MLGEGFLLVSMSGLGHPTSIYNACEKWDFWMYKSDVILTQKLYVPHLATNFNNIHCPPCGLKVWYKNRAKFNKTIR